MLNSYMPEDLINLDERTLRQEYTRLRDIGQKRIKRLLQSEFGMDSTSKYFGGDIPKLKSLSTKEEIAFGLSELKGFIDSPRSRVGEVRKQYERQRMRRFGKIVNDEIEVGEDAFGLKFLLEGEENRSHKNKVAVDRIRAKHPNFDLPYEKADEFFDFMNSQVAYNLETIFGSERNLAVFKLAVQKGINLNSLKRNQKLMTFFAANLENLEHAELPKGTRRTAQAYKRYIEDEISHGRDYSPFSDTAYMDVPKRKRKTRRKKRK